MHYTSAVTSGQGLSAVQVQMVFLLATGGILFYAGMTNIGVSRWVKRGQPSALAITGSTTVALIVYLVRLLPLPDAGSFATRFLVSNGIYLFLLILVWLTRGRK